MQSGSLTAPPSSSAKERGGSTWPSQFSQGAGVKLSSAGRLLFSSSRGFPVHIVDVDQGSFNFEQPSCSLSCGPRMAFWAQTDSNGSGIHRCIRGWVRWALGISTTTSATNRLMLLVAKQMDYITKEADRIQRKAP